MSVVTPQDLADPLGQDVQEDRARMIIVQAEALCRAVVSPLPEGAGAVVLSVAAGVRITARRAAG
ncbi:hypothetical protein [Streptomyces ehimensis]|uniref:Uncharacterized protein n=1 Tax=Streptomyces ehimensis TaxID=68195 RepID=A0ABV9BVC6_9ACTN